MQLSSARRRQHQICCAMLIAGKNKILRICPRAISSAPRAGWNSRKCQADSMLFAISVELTCESFFSSGDCFQICEKQVSAQLEAGGAGMNAAGGRASGIPLGPAGGRNGGQGRGQGRGMQGRREEAGSSQMDTIVRVFVHLIFSAHCLAVCSTAILRNVTWKTNRCCRLQCMAVQVFFQAIRGRLASLSCASPCLRSPVGLAAVCEF